MRYQVGVYEAKCPYFIYEGNKKIKCETMTEGDTFTRFTDNETKVKYLRKECSRFPNNCPLFIKNEKEYEAYNG